MLHLVWGIHSRPWLQQSCSGLLLLKLPATCRRAVLGCQQKRWPAWAGVEMPGKLQAQGQMADRLQQRLHVTATLT